MFDRKKYNREYYRKNANRLNSDRRLLYSKSIKIRKNKKIYALKNRKQIQKRMKIYHKEYYANNKVSVKKRTYKYHRNKYKTDINFRLAFILRVSLNRAVKGKQKLGISGLKNLGCSIEDFKLYIESKFKTGMSWDNYGRNGWHLDHIKPISKFNLKIKTEIKKACNYKNFQPLWREENQSKGNRYE